VHPILLHQETPLLEDRDWKHISTGETAAHLDRIEIKIEIEPWFRDEPERDFRSRAIESFRNELHRYVESAKEERVQWEMRPELERTEYIYALAFWQSGATLSTIQQKLSDDGHLNVGIDSIVKGLDRAAEFIQIDRLQKG
jgi:hypothetical protein